MDLRTSYLALAEKKFREGRYFWPIQQFVKFPLTKLSHAVKHPLTGPYHGTIFVTYRCNYRCVFCDLPIRAIEEQKRGEKELTTPQMKQILDDFAAIGTTGIGFTGGEPMMRTDMLELVAYTKGLGMLTHMSHNGSFAAMPTMAGRMYDSGLDAINISIDGFVKTHNWGRGVPTAFERASQAVRNLVEIRNSHPNKMTIMVTCVVTEKNLEELEDLVYYIRDLGADRIGFMPVQDLAVLRNKEKRASGFNVKTMKKAQKTVNRLIQLRKKGNLGGGFSIDTSVAYLQLFMDSFGKKALSIPCYAGYITMTVDGYGNYYPCFPWAEMIMPVGNVREMRLRDFWTSAAMVKTRERVHACRDCFWNNQTELNVLANKKIPL